MLTPLHAPPFLNALSPCACLQVYRALHEPLMCPTQCAVVPVVEGKVLEAATEQGLVTRLQVRGARHKADALHILSDRLEKARVRKHMVWGCVHMCDTHSQASHKAAFTDSALHTFWQPFIMPS